MAKKNVSDTIAQQRKAREEFLELKKMQHGEIQAPPKPSEMAVEPKTFSEKLKNYWFHFKWHTLGTIFCLIAFAVMISQCASRTNWDMQVIYFTYTPVLDQQTDEISNYLGEISKDINGDGEVNIQVVNCSMPTDNASVQYSKTILSKLQAIIAAEPEALLFITDADSVTYFEADALNNFFGTEQIALGEKFYTNTESKEFGKLPEGLQIACRRVDNTVVESKKNVGAVYNESLNILEKLKEK